jgi:uncharacterized membrane protein
MVVMNGQEVVLTASAAIAGALVAAHVTGPISATVVVAACLVNPGWLVAWRLRFHDELLAWSITIAVSLAVWMLIGLGAIHTSWRPNVIVAAVLLACALVGVVTGVVRLFRRRWQVPT